MIVRVLPNVSGLSKQFDYRVPDALVAEISIGAVVRADLQGRRVSGWVTEIDPDDSFDDGELSDLTKYSSVGPSRDLIDLAMWAAHRWVGRPRHFLNAATPRRFVRALTSPDPVRAGPRSGDAVNDLDKATDPSDAPSDGRSDGPALSPATSELLAAGGGLLRLPPTEDPVPAIRSGVEMGPTLVIEPSILRASALARRLRKLGLSVALMPDQWKLAANGTDVVIGPRIAVWARCPALAAIIVLDEHDEALQAEGSPTWHARDVAIERGARADVPVVLVSPTPTLTAIEWANMTRTPSPERIRRAWPDVVAIDRSDTEPWKRSLLSSELIQELRNHDRRVVCVSNTPGRAGLLACRHCRQLTSCEHCDASVQQLDDHQLVCRRCGTERPVVCQSCGRTALANVRPGVSRLTEEIEAAAGRPAILVEGAQDGLPAAAGVYVGTEAVLHRVTSADTVVFLEFDREVLAPRYRAGEQAMALVVRAARLVGPRGSGGKVMLQTFNPDHPVIHALCTQDFDAMYADETQRRRLLQLPPFAALAEVAGSGATEFIDSAGVHPGVTVAPDEDGYAVRAHTWSELSDFLGGGVRPPGARLRIAVDPAR